MESLQGVLFKTTHEISVTDKTGNWLMHETQVYTGDYETIQWTVHLSDDMGRVTDVFRSDGSHMESIWGCCVKMSDTDGQGVTNSW